jgi:hypothetical protein
MSFFVTNNNIFTGGNSITVEIVTNNNLCKWLVDTGATISAMKYEYAKKLNLRIVYDSMSIKGIGGRIKSIGYTTLLLRIENEIYKQKIYVFQSLPCTTMGILGHDFLSKNKAILNYNNNTVSLITRNNQFISLKFNMKTKYSIPPRSESFHYVDTNFSEDCVICAEEISDGVYIASAIVRPIDGKIPIKILNTNEKEIKLNNIKPNIHKLDDYNHCYFGSESKNAIRVKNLLGHLSLDHLNIQESKEIQTICAKYCDIFNLPGDKLTVTNLCKQSIQLKPNVQPTFVKNYRLPQAQKYEIDRQIKNMLDDGIIEKAQSEWSSPLLLVPKKMDTSGERKWRIVIDYRKLNEKIQDDKYPLPNITEILDSLSGSVYFSHLDLFSGYYQQELDKESRKYTAFCSGQYQMTRLPMGLKISPSSFSRMITMAMSGLTYEKCFVYLDDIVVFGRNLGDHNKNLISIFERLRKVNLKLNPTKCDFLKKEVLYLGHIVSAEGILPDPNKISAITGYPRPTNEKETRSFVALTNYYRKFIPNFADKAYYLNQLSRKDVKFNWDSNCQKAFDTLKEAISNPPILQYPDFNQSNTFILHTDASGYALGAVLSNGDGRPVAYASRGLNKAELNYATIEKELLAIVWSTKHFKPYLYGRHFVIKTDHKPLIYLFNMRDPSSRLIKFRLALEEYNFTVEYVKGKENTVADVLSRIKITSEELREMNETINIMTRKMKKSDMTNKKINYDNENYVDSRPDQPKVVEVNTKRNACVTLTLIKSSDYEELRKLNKSEVKESKTLIYVEKIKVLYMKPFIPLQTTRAAFVRELGEKCKEWNIEEIIIIKNENNNIFVEKLAHEIKKNKDWTGPRLCVLKDIIKINDKDDKKIILNDFHLLPSSGHAGIRKMYNNIKRQYFWVGLEKDIKDYVSKCDKCQKEKFSKYTKEPMKITTTAHTAFQKIFLDIVGPIDKDAENYSYILTLQCELTKYVEAYPLISKSAKQTAEAFVNNFILRYGIPETVTTDRGTEFISTTFKEVCKLLHINQMTSTAYHHETIGALENSHKSLGAYLRIQTSNHGEHWSKWLPFWCFSYNTSVHTETKFTPFELVFGKRCKVPSNLLSHVEPLYNYENYPLELRYRLQVAQKEARENLINSKIIRKEKYDIKTKHILYKPNDKILIRNENRDKMSSVFSGPYNVIRDLSPNVEISKNGKLELVHKNRTKPYKC